VTADLEALDSRVQHALDATQKQTTLTNDEEELRVLCAKCDEVAQQLPDRLRKLVVRPANLRQWKSIRKALKSVWSKSDIDALAERLDGYRRQLNTRFLVDLSYAAPFRMAASKTIGLNGVIGSFKLGTSRE